MENRCKIISFVNHKGGVGKTTSVACVGTLLAQRGYRVLVVDLDAQANLTSSLYSGRIENSIYQSMTGGEPLPVIAVDGVPNLHLVPPTWIWR